ncbi:GPI mannosyltransferase 2 [Scheffersomyces xylosifermentans]|uniref:GPI mannosyltransferase 2 n=1 Tax=Scheffersomyces xylosifermentans TaxID=1304137 RepID=UPI00315DDAC9
MTMIPPWKLIKTFVAIKSIQLAIVYFTPSQFDTSSELIIENHTTPYGDVLTTILNKFIVWDAVYFTDLFVNQIKYEHQYVFCPSWLKFIKWIPIGNADYYSKLLLSLIVSNILHFISVVLVYYLSLQFFKQNKTLALRSALLMVVAPAGIFLTANYSENLSNVLSFASILSYDKSINPHDPGKNNTKSIVSKPLYVLSGIFTAVNFTVRANSLLLGIPYLLDLFEFGLVEDAIWCLIAGGSVFLSLVWTSFTAYREFCPARGEWCNNTLPILFSYAQKKYWGNGFLQYWSPNNIPNFLIAIPVIIIHILSIHHFWIQLPILKNVLPWLVVNVAVILGGIFFWNVQILVRISSFLPLSYWYVAQLQEPSQKIFIYYMLIWGFVQAVLFAAFLPPA